MANGTKAYLGDGAYVEFDGCRLVLTAENGICATDRVVLEPEVWGSLVQYVERLRSRAAPAAPVAAGDQSPWREIQEPTRDELVELLQAIARNDETRFEHHQPRRWDGRRPSEDGSTIWLTPREMAQQALRALGAPIPNAIDEAVGRAAQRT